MLMKYNFNNIRCKLGQLKNGVQYGGQNILRNLNISKAIINNISIRKNTDYLQIHNTVLKNINNNIMSINLGGDHSISAGTIQPLIDTFKDELLVIWIDAHADINTQDTSTTKNTHGMPVSALMGFMNHWYNINSTSYLKSKNLIYFGIRDIDEPEKKIISNNNIQKYSNFENLLDKINQHPAKYIHISCDIDALDSSEMPSTGTKVPNGLKMNDVLSVINLSKKK